MGRVKGYMTVEEHITLGRELYVAREKLMDVIVRVTTKYSANKSPAKKLLTAVDRIDSARSMMDDHFSQERADSFCPYVYYPGGQDGQDHHVTIGCETCYPTTAQTNNDTITDQPRSTDSHV